MADARSQKRKILESCINKLLKDYEDAMNQSIDALGKPEQNQLQRQAEDIWERIESLQNKISALELAPSKDFDDVSKPDAADFQLKLESRLFKIDFEIVEKTIKKILDDHGVKGCAALLLFQESDDRAGKLCARRIREILQDKEYPGFRPIEIEFHEKETLNEKTFLTRLQQHLVEQKPKRDGSFELNSIEDIKHQVLEKLCGSLRNGSIVMIECRKMDLLLERSEMIDWIVEEFWGSLVRKLNVVFGHFYAVRVIMLLFVDASLPKDVLKVEQCCTVEDFKQDKLLEIPLEEQWSQTVIRKWIASWAHLSWFSADIDRVADRIYQSSKGVPWRVISKLPNACCAEIDGQIEENQP